MLENFTEISSKELVARIIEATPTPIPAVFYGETTQSHPTNQTESTEMVNLLHQLVAKAQSNCKSRSFWARKIKKTNLKDLAAEAYDFFYQLPEPVELLIHNYTD